MTSPIITSESLGKLICEAVGLDPSRVARIVLELSVNQAATLYVQMWGSPVLLDIDWGDVLKDVEVIKLSDSE